MARRDHPYPYLPNEQKTEGRTDKKVMICDTDFAEKKSYDDDHKEFQDLLDNGIISIEEFETVLNIQMKGKREELRRLFRDNGLEDKFKFTYCKSDGRYKIRIPVALRDKYELKAEYKQNSEREVIDILYSDYRKMARMRMSLDEIYKLWRPERIKRIVQRDRSMHTAKKNFEVYESLVLGTDFGRKTFAKIRYADFEEFYSICEGMHISKSRANEIKTTLNKIWEFGKAIGLVDINYSKEFYLTDFKFAPKKAKPVKTADDRERLIEYYLSLDTVYGYVCALMECLNFRICEIKALKWSDIYMEDDLICVSHMVDHEGNYREFTKNHDDEGIHFVPISPRAKSILETIKRKEYGFRDDFVFLGKNDNYILTGECNNNIHKACEALGIRKNFTTHDCRRYAATNAALEGMSTPAMQMAFGWKDRDTAEKYIQIAAARQEHQSMLVNVLN